MDTYLVSVLLLLFYNKNLKNSTLRLTSNLIKVMWSKKSHYHKKLRMINENKSALINQGWFDQSICCCKNHQIHICSLFAMYYQSLSGGPIVKVLNGNFLISDNEVGTMVALLPWPLLHQLKWGEVITSK